MASYAALLSLFHTLNNINIHPRPPISLHQEQLHSLTQNITFFQHFLECHHNQEDEDLESRIAGAAYAAEDVIETHIVDQIHHARSTCNSGENISSGDLYGGLESVIEDMNLIKREAMHIIQEKVMRPQHHNLHTNSSLSTASGGTASSWQSISAPRFDDAMINQVLDNLTGEQGGLQIISIVGMGGIGKTTFARNIYANPLIIQYFDVMAWVTISQEYSTRNILQVLCQEVKGSINGLSEMSEDKIGEIIYKHLCGKRYLIVMDDIWKVDAWYEVMIFFPNNNGSRIMITTRLSNLAFELSGGRVFHMQFLDGDKSWDLLCEIVFGKQDCPSELQEIGKEIAIKCRGLPLSIVVIGGLLKKSNMTRPYWIYTLENLNLLINLENDEYTLRLLGTSYKELPIHLKPCFLYMGIFPEDEKLKLSILVKLWVAEGILRPIDDKSFEEVAKEYLRELINRNLILISELRWNGKPGLYKVHDLLRDVCLREAQKQKFFCILRQQEDHLPQDINMERCICINPNASNRYSPEFLHAVESASLTRSLLYTGDTSPSLRFRLLRVYSPVVKYSLALTDYDSAIFEQANLRYLTIHYRGELLRFHSFCSLLWNLQTLKVYCWANFTFKIWEMPLLRHVTVNKFVLPDPPNGEHNFVLENLQTLSCIMNFKCSEEVVKRIPNLKKLKVKYDISVLDDDEVLANSCLNNLDRLQKLESLSLSIYDNCDVEKIMRNLVSFPHSLKKLTLQGTWLYWEELTTRIGSLPLLQVLKLGTDACLGATWKTTEGKFCSLRVLRIRACEELKYWETESSHFPRLEILCLDCVTKLKEIPSSIGDIHTLKSIQLVCCSKSAVVSAETIIEEQRDYGNENLDLQVVREYEEDSEEGDQVVSEDEEDEEEEDEEEGDQVVSDSYAEEGDPAVSDSYAEDEEEGDPAVSDSYQEAIRSQVLIQVRMQEKRRKEIKLYRIRKQKKKNMMRKEIKMSQIRNVEDEENEEEGDQVVSDTIGASSDFSTKSCSATS